MTTNIRKATMRPRQQQCMCSTLRPKTNNGPQKLAIALPEGVENNTNVINVDEEEGNTVVLSEDEIEKIEIDLQKRTVEWACELVPKAVHKPPEDGANIDAPMEAKFRLDRIEVGIIQSQIVQQRAFTEKQQKGQNDDKNNTFLTPYVVSPDVKSQLGNLLYPLLVDVRFPEQFQIVSVPSSIFLIILLSFYIDFIHSNSLWF
jgi:hypothetical protein